MTPEPRRTRWARTAPIAALGALRGAAPESTAQVCATESILPSSFCDDPSGVPSSQ